MPETGGGAGDLSTAAVAEQGLQITLRLECWR
jgi:hypothetical protein